MEGGTFRRGLASAVAADMIVVGCSLDLRAGEGEKENPRALFENPIFLSRTNSTVTWSFLVFEREGSRCWGVVFFFFASEQMDGLSFVWASMP
jgi:hypothetical protein